MANRLVHLAAVAKADLDLGWMDVHIDPAGIDLHIQRIHRLPLAMQDVLVGAARRMGEHFVAHVATIDVGELVVGAGAGDVGDTRAACHPDGPRAVVDVDTLLEQFAAQYIGQALLAGRGAPLFHQPAVMPDREANVGPGQRMPPHGLDAMRKFRGVALEKLAPRRRREKQFLDFDRGADCARGWPQFAASAVECEAAGLAAGA